MRQWSRLYSGWLWQDVPGLDELVFWPPLSTPDDPASFARELYHRHFAHLLGMRAWRYEWLSLLAAVIASLVGFVILDLGLHPLLPLGIILAILGIAFAVIGARFALSYLMPTAVVARERKTASELVRRLCLRDIPDGTPSDLADPWRQGWIGADGRPLAADIGEFDLRSTELVSRSGAIFWTAIVVGLIPMALLGFAPLAATVILIVAIIKMLRDPAPVARRAKLLDAAAAGTAESAAWAFAGASAWTARAEDARAAQLVESLRDTTPVLKLGTSLGVLAARGDSFAPSMHLDMCLSLEDLMQHLLVLGGTGSGKTAGVLRPLCQQIGMLENVGLVILDGKGSLPGEIAELVAEMSVIDPATKVMSLVEGLTPTEVVATVSDLLGRAQGKDRFFEDSAAGLMRHAAVIALADGDAMWSLSGIWNVASNGPSEAQLETADLTNPQVAAAVDFFRKEWPNVEREVRSSILATLRAWYTTITAHPDTLKWAQTPAGKSDVDIIAALRGKRVGILAPAHRYGQAGPVVMALLKARLFAAIRDRADRGMRAGETPVVMVMDEAQEVVAKQDALILGIARSLKLGIVASTQTVEGIEARLDANEAAQFLTLFGSIVALQNRSARTAALAAERMGAAFRPLLEAVPGVPTVRSAVTAQRAAGRLAAAKMQPAIASTIIFGDGGLWQDILAAINPFQLFRRTVGGEQERPHSRVAAVPLLQSEELSDLAVEPNTALAILTRARVPRRDVVKLNPVY